MAAALAGLLAVTLPATGGSPPVVASPPADSGFATQIANLTSHSSARPDSSTAAELRRLADVAARQPTPVLGPVVYAKTANWGLDLGATHYGLGYRSHETNTEENWTGSDGAYLSVVTYPGGKIPPNIIPVNTRSPSADGKANYAKYGTPSLPATESLMRQRLLLPCRSGQCASSDETTNIVLNGMDLMDSDLMPSAARAALLGVLADAAASPGPHQAFFNLGSVTDRAGHQAVAIGFEYQRYVSTAPNDGCGGSQSASTSSSDAVAVTCSGSIGGPASGGDAASIVTTPGAGDPTPGGTVPSGPPELWVLVFNPNTGAFVGEEFAYCSGPVNGHLATGKCTAESYAQLLELKAVASVPPAPAGSTPNTPPVTGSAPASTAVP
jgi:hypothetical protein